MSSNIEHVGKIIDFLVEENIEKIKTTMTDDLIDNLHESIDTEWIVMPDEVALMWNEMLKKCVKAALKKYQDRITEAIESWIEYMIAEITEKYTDGRYTDRW